MALKKKNEVKEEPEILEPAAQSPLADILNGFDEKALVGLLFDKMFAGVKDDKRIMLLNAMKPFVSEKRQKGIDDCIRIMNLVAFFENLTIKAGK